MHTPKTADAGMTRINGVLIRTAILVAIAAAALNKAPYERDSCKLV